MIDEKEEVEDRDRWWGFRRNRRAYLSRLVREIGRNSSEFVNRLSNKTNLDCGAMII